MLSKLASVDNDSIKSWQDCNSSLCETIRDCRKLMAKHPKDPDVPGILQVCLQICCDWSGYGQRLKKLSDLVDKHLRDKLKPPVANRSINLYPLSLQQQLGIATYFSQLSIPKSPSTAIPYWLGGDRLRIGYVSSGAEKFPLVGKRCRHDLEKFDIFYYTYEVGTAALQKTDNQWTHEHICDLTKFGSSELAAWRIAADGIQILVNLTESGKKDGKLDEILAVRPAPMQVVYRTDLGSTGASYVDYFITDKVASPLHFAYGYSEKLAYMPNGMFVCDHPEWLIKSHENPEETEKVRRRCRLPQSAIVFAADCQSYQIDPDTFEHWCQILQRVPKSVLWLLMPHYAQTKINLVREAKRHNINPNRLIFVNEAEVVGWASVNNLIDVVLDTPAYNTAGLIKPISFGIPVVTMPRESFISRLTASLLTSVNCRELIAKSKSEYVQIAVNLGNKPQLLAEMRAKMTEILPDSNLFATDRYFADLENLYEKMWKWRKMGEKPEHLV